MPAKITEAQRTEAIASLRESLPPGSTAYTVLRHVSASGMSRDISVHSIEDGEIRWLTWLAHKAGRFSWSEKNDAIRMGGCGMDMGFALVYNLSYALYPDGFGCIGENCPSNDHSNGDRDYTPDKDRWLGFASCPDCKALPMNNPHGCPSHSHWHRDGGYALRQRWI